MRSDSVKIGTSQAPHRSLFNALGYTEEEAILEMNMLGHTFFMFLNLLKILTSL